MATRRLGGIATSSSVPDNGGDNSGGGGGSGGGYVDDVFSTYLYTGTGADDHDIENGIDLAGEGGMFWLKNRTDSSDHCLFDSERSSFDGVLNSNKNSASGGAGGFTGNEDGFSIPSGSLNWNSSGKDYVSWTFRKAPSFFDVVTYTGTGVYPSNVVIPHNLGVEPGMIIVKNASNPGMWYVWHKTFSNPLDDYMILNQTNPTENASGLWGTSGVTSTSFSVQGGGSMDTLNDKYVAYLFANDDSDDGSSLIKCGSYTGTGAAVNEIDLGWEPQWLLFKSATKGEAWTIFDTARGITVGGNDEYLMPDNSGAGVSKICLDPTSTGFKITRNADFLNGSGDTYIYMAIRRPNKPAEEFEPEELFAVTPATNTNPRYISGFPVDMAIRRYVTDESGNYLHSRLTGNVQFSTDNYGPEAASNDAWMDYNNGMTDPDYVSANADQLAWMWRRTPHFMDVVCYEGDGQVGREVPHNLGVAPEMMWVKSRGPNTAHWRVYDSINGPTKGLWLNQDYGSGAEPNWWSNTAPTNGKFTVGGESAVNAINQSFIAYLFASVPGISAIGSYTGNGAESQAIYPDGFSGQGVNFVLIKRTDGTGNWIVIDRKQSLDGAIALNNSDAQKAGKFWSWMVGGFLVWNIETHGPDWNPNIAGAEYIYYAIAQ